MVYLASKNNSRELVAIKDMIPDNTSAGITSPTLKEAVTLTRLETHPNIVQLIATYIEPPNKIILVEEFVQHTLTEYITQHKIRPIEETDMYMIQLLSALSHLHERGIVHCDLKLDNILFDSVQHEIKLADFGSIRQLSLSTTESYSPEVGSYGYVAPETLIGISGKYGTAIDVWAACVIYIVLQLGYNPFFNRDVSHVLNPYTQASNIASAKLIFQQLGSPNETRWPGFMALNTFGVDWGNINPRPWFEELRHVEILKEMLQINPTQICTAKQALNKFYNQ